MANVAQGLSVLEKLSEKKHSLDSAGKLSYLLFDAAK